MVGEEHLRLAVPVQVSDDGWGQLLGGAQQPIMIVIMVVPEIK